MSLQEYNEAMIWKIMYDQFANQMQVFMNVWGSYDSDTLALASDAEYKERMNRLADITQAYVSISIEILNTETLLKRIDAMIEPIKDNPDYEPSYNNWMSERFVAETWLEKQKTLLEQAKSQFAMFRPIGMIQAFEQKKKRGNILGAGRELMNSLLGKKKQSEREAEAIAEEIGAPNPLDPAEEFDKAVEHSKGDD